MPAPQNVGYVVSAESNMAAMVLAERIRLANVQMQAVRDMDLACGDDALGKLVRQLLMVVPMWAREWSHDTLRAHKQT